MSSLTDTFLERHEHGNYEDKGSRNKWLWSWLDVVDCNGDYFAKYIRKTKAAGKAVCLICNRGQGKTLDYSESGMRALQLHAKTKKHKADRELQKNVTLPSSFQRQADLETGVCQPARVVSISANLIPYGTTAHTHNEIQSSSTNTDIDGDACHHVHNIVKMFSSKVDAEKHLAKLLDDISHDFSFSADLRADLLELCELLKKPALTPVERIEHSMEKRKENSLKTVIFYIIQANPPAILNIQLSSVIFIIQLSPVFFLVKVNPAIF
ncbi:hypothetical protein PoB_006308000 [Plakobranchus ocellatus]|uniref:BED-type domain-containing protein n=1 Tax=Plakobranchus ocellatus TaxID=259542 RepID=A0AAV4CXR6_9GAST|nr:hypothetical protein PoB_006308000 [Plakobranchus ocellatus]